MMYFITVNQPEVLELGRQVLITFFVITATDFTK
jgi:hypothetical protein